MTFESHDDEPDEDTEFGDFWMTPGFPEPSLPTGEMDPEFWKLFVSDEDAEFGEPSMPFGEVDPAFRELFATHEDEVANGSRKPMFTIQDILSMLT